MHFYYDSESDSLTVQQKIINLDENNKIILKSYNFGESAKIPNEGFEYIHVPQTHKFGQHYPEVLAY